MMKLSVSFDEIGIDPVVDAPSVCTMKFDAFLVKQFPEWDNGFNLRSMQFDYANGEASVDMHVI